MVLPPSSLSLRLFASPGQSFSDLGRFLSEDEDLEESAMAKNATELWPGHTPESRQQYNKYSRCINMDFTKPLTIEEAG